VAGFIGEKTSLPTRSPSSSPEDLDQSPEFDPADPEPIPEDHFHQSRDT
jgi:hypothetical protein